MFKKQQLKPANSRPLKSSPNIKMIVNRFDILPTTAITSTNTENNHIKVSVSNVQRLIRILSNVSIERCCFLLIHLSFYITILTMICIKFEQFNNKQEKLFRTLTSNDNLTLHENPYHRLLDYNQ